MLGHSVISMLPAELNLEGKLGSPEPSHGKLLVKGSKYILVIKVMGLLAYDVGRFIVSSSVKQLYSTTLSPGLSN